ncbi:MAG: nucleotidyltransferase domain-containing protein [Salinicola sp.]|uniref:type VII toxin-antitoxin system MntA family adenylyltransferase antitoxin n=1 Tax=Salinicola sp. TaxID=1978524 RepID=UPI001DE097E8|nr:nucleotidyltransferase domain-containing protein [Salinicola sp.]NRB58028.1 nucleotidyltransferase domain-containing protein [Salinicola sp.]
MKNESEDVAALGQRIVQALSGFAEIEQLVLFGSLAQGSGRPDSDLDLAVDVGRPLTSEQKIAMIETLALALDRPVDLIDLKTAGQPLLTQIVTKGRRLLGSDNAWAKIIYRNIIDNEDFVPLQRRILKARQKAWIKP